MPRTDDLRIWKLFCEVVEAGGVNAACDRLQCEPSTVSRALKAIEADIGVHLFHREKRPLELTESGRIAYEKAQNLLHAHEEMMGILRGDRERFSGLIRLAAHGGIGPTEITPGLVQFQSIYPDVELELHQLTNTVPAAFSNNGQMLDVVVGYGPDAPMPGIVARYLGQMPFIPCASPLYLQRNGNPRHPNDCLRHTGILLRTPTRNSTETLSRGNETAFLNWRKTLRFNSLISAKSAAILGAGIMPDMALYHCVEELRSKQLVPVFSGWRRKAAFCYICATEAAWEKRRVRVFVDWLAERERQLFAKLREEFPEFYV